MKVSIIIPTYNGAHRILNVLRALEKQVFLDFETIVVIDGSTDGTLELLEREKTQLNVRVIYQENQGRAVVRNRGAAEALGELLIFFDDDMRPDVNCVPKHIQHHRDRAGSICVGTQLTEPALASSEMQSYKLYCSKKWEQPLLATVGKPLTQDQLYITAANFSIPTAIFQQLGGFDERLNDAEDYDLAVRAFQQGIAIFYNPQSHAWHDESYTLEQYIERRKGYVAAHRFLIQKKAEIYQRFRQRTVQRQKRWKKFVFWIFSFRCWTKWVDEYRVFRRIPAALRFKLYDLIITSRVIYFPGS